MIPIKPVEKKNFTMVSSYGQSVFLGTGSKIIGERINPTGKKRFKQALKEHDLDYILREGITQQDNGAHILDVNVGLPDIDEPALMKEVVQELQSVTSLPLQIDTVDVEAMEGALRIYNGDGQFCQRKAGVYGQSISTDPEIRRSRDRTCTG